MHKTPFSSSSSFPLLLAFVVGGLGFEFCVLVAGRRHALRSEWPFIIIINDNSKSVKYKIGTIFINICNNIEN